MKPHFIELAGQRLGLLADKGVWVIEHQTLLVADPHFGKDATFRHHHVPVPQGATGATLASLSRMILAVQAKRVVFLGDLFHARSSQTAQVMETLDGFFDQHSDLQWWWTLGNHDVGLSPLPASWGIEIADQHALGEIQLAHHPSPLASGTSLRCCGHIHPAIRFGSAVESVGRLPCFWHSNDNLVLPAIGHFTGTHVVKLRAQDRAWMIVEDQVLPAHRPTVPSAMHR